MMSFEEQRQRALEDTTMEMYEKKDYNIKIYCMIFNSDENFLSVFRGDCDDPVTILRVFQNYFMRGRPLDPVDESTFIEGQTTDIFVSSLNIYEDGMDEILTERVEPCDRSFLLEVTFTGENARDFGGPRREFLSQMLRCIRENLCVENNGEGEGVYLLHDNVTARTNRYYVGAGIIFGTF